ncbi:uncharacterized protein LOC119348314 [Triticum dicoccoides]|uniref:uncharacterized protein LOC119348314 n=1 Tax=Triticum dicoccoides TaxID=85692 RepID=UPI00188E331C|nr:uncharacterized protein LOC119348314 [Triticum dicoccoides]
MDCLSSMTKSDLERMLFDETAEPKALPLSLLAEITNGFSDKQEIGEGGFAVVYQGMLNGGKVAVKRLSKTHLYEKEFQREVECLMMAKHKNVVRFLGYCADTQGSAERYNGKFVMADVQRRLLFFEYLPNGSLDKYITDTSRKLPWRNCYKIIQGICQGLHYLHVKKIVHLDLKPANILLDDNLVPKIADFGLSRCFEDIQSRVFTQNIGGTLGYLAPEFGNGVITYKFDVYSLGAIIIEILTGEKGYHTVDTVVEIWSEKLVKSHSDIQLQQVRVCTEIGIECIDSNPAKRPDTQNIIDRLNETGSMVGYMETSVITSQLVESSLDELHQDRPKTPEETSSEDSSFYRSSKLLLHQTQPGAWNLDSDLEAGKTLASQNWTDNIVSIQKVRPVVYNSYTPQRVPIGPYHRSCSSTRIEKEKLRYVGFMQTVSETRGTGGLSGLGEGLELRARDWYVDGVADMTPEELARMLLHDGCYLLGRLGNYPGHSLPQACNFDNTEFRDVLYLIDNQLPFFVLEEIHERVMSSDCSLSDSLVEYVRRLLAAQLYISPGQKRLMKQPCHLLHLVHTYFHPNQVGCGWSDGFQALTGRWRRATEYRLDANVKFMPREFSADVTSILDVRLEGGTLWIPRLHVNNDTWTLLQNLMTLEEQMPKRPVTAYCIFMSQLACTPEDIRLLVDANIVQHFLASDQIAAQGFVGLLREVVMDVDNIDRNYLRPIWHRLEMLAEPYEPGFLSRFRFFSRKGRKDRFI